MSSWLNFNDSLNNIKGQLSNFATTVLADDADNVNSSNFDELKEICAKQEEEIRQLHALLEGKKVNNEYGESTGANKTNNDSWNWEESKESTSSSGQDKIVNDLKIQLEEMQREKKELISQLDQLDADNQQNISEIMAIKEKLQDQYADVKDKLAEQLQLNKKLSNNEAQLKKSYDELSTKYKEIENKLNINESGLSDHKTQQIIQENQNLKTTNEEIKKEIAVLKSSKSTLEKVLEDLKKSSDATENYLKEVEAEKKIIFSELHKAKQNIEIFEKKSIEDSDTCAKLAVILDTYEKQVGSLNAEIKHLQVTNEEECALLKQEIKMLKQTHEETIKSLRSELQQHSDEVNPETYEKMLQNVKSEVHLKYVKILTDNVKRYMDEEWNLDNSEPDNCPQVNEFNKQVENLIKILSDFKYKCETLETEVYELSQEKTKILSEKNFEIEKLMQNSEMLSQDLLSKSQALKEYGNECAELEKNNEILIKELDTFKNSSGLQTISESNEDNLLLLESQLENANKRVEDLEKIIDDFEKQQSESNVDANYGFSVRLNESEKRVEELEKIIVDMEKEKLEKLNDYEVLSKKYSDILAEYEIVKEKLAKLEGTVQKVTEENAELKAANDKMKMDLDNVEYQIAEDNVNMETLKEECESLKKKIDMLIAKNKTLRIMHTETEKSNEDMRSELNSFREKVLCEEDLRKQAESQIKMLTEKLQHSKVSETTLKLQCDTLNKELKALADAKYGLEVSLQKTNSDVQQFEDNYKQLQDQNDELTENLKKVENENQQLNIVVTELNVTIEDLKVKIEEKAATEESNNDADGSGQIKSIENQQSLEFTDNTQLQEKISTLETELQQISSARMELINLIQTKDQESISYYNEIQRLTQILRTEAEKTKILESQLKELQQASLHSDEIEVLKQQNEKLSDQNSFLRQKCEVLAENLLQEQSKIHSILAEKPSASDREQALTKELERLKSHLIEVEETLTQEVLETEQKNAELMSKMKDIEEREKNSSTMYTSISIRANQQVEVLQKQVQALTNQREELRLKISEAEDHNNKQAAALANLQLVLEQFQKDREKDVSKETERIRRRITTEKLVQDELKKEIIDLKQQLEESKQGLQAATRLSEQLELSKKLNIALKEEVSQLKTKLDKSEETIQNLTGQTDGKIEKSLIKNLIIGYVSSNKNINKDQSQILKIIATVLDFNQQDHDKVNSLQNQQGSWLGSLLMPQSGQNMTEESLSKAFVKFLENESKPRNVPSLLGPSAATETAAKPSKSSNPKQAPIVLSEISLPTFADFGQNRNSSSILKDVLKDSSNNS